MQTLNVVGLSTTIATGRPRPYRLLPGHGRDTPFRSAQLERVVNELDHLVSKAVVTFSLRGGCSRSWCVSVALRRTDML